MSKVRVDTIATSDDSEEFSVAEITALRDQVVAVQDEIDALGNSLTEDITNLDAAAVKKTSATGAAIIPSGPAAQRPGSPSNGLFRYNTETNQFEGYQNGEWGQVGGGSPLFSVMWWPQRSAIPSGFVAADGQVLSRATYPVAWAGIQAGNVPTVADATWLSTATERGKFTAGNGTTTFRLPDYNGKAAGSLGAVFLRGDGTLSAAAAGVIQQDAFQGHHHAVDPATGVGGWSSTAAIGDGPGYSSNVIKSTAGTYQWVRGPISDGTNGAPRTASETRPLNVTGCWIIKLFGAVTEVGSANAAQLATDYANLAGSVSVLEGKVAVLDAGIKQMPELLWSGVAGTGGTVLTLSRNLQVGDIVWVSHTDSYTYPSAAIVVTADKLVPGAMLSWPFGIGGGSSCLFNGTNQLTISALTNGYPIGKVYASRAKN